MTADVEKMVIPGKVILPFSYSAGRTASRFFTELRDYQRIMGKRCPLCRRVIVPARLFCNDCFVETTEWIEVGPQGTLVTFTVVYRQELHHPQEPPLAYGIIKLDGADTSMVHLLGGADLKKLDAGIRVEAVFQEKREGRLTDIKHFKPL